MAGVVVPALALALLGACGGDPDRDLSAADRRACEDFLAALPESVADQGDREVAEDDGSATWGDPPIELRCAVPLPEDFATSPCVTRDGIGWSIPADQADDVTTDVVMTLAFREPVVQVRVPADYRPTSPADVMADLDAAVREHTTAQGRCQ